MKLLALALAAAVLATPAVARTPACPSPFSIERHPLLTLEDLSKFGGEPTFVNSDDMYLHVQSFDDEEHPIRAKKFGIAVLYGGRIGEGEEVLGGMVWSTVIARLDDSKTEAMNKRHDGFFAVFTVVDPPNGCLSRDFVVHLDKAGGLWVGGRKVDQLKPEG